MAEEQQNYDDGWNQMASSLRSMEEKQRLLKERMLLIGKNLIGLRDEQGKDIAKMKGDIEEIKEEVEKIKKSNGRMAEEMVKKARKKEIERLNKQIKMFSPLGIPSKEEIREMIQEEIDANNK